MIVEPCGKIHKFKLYICCSHCERESEFIVSRPCKASDRTLSSAIEPKRLGCIKCRTSKTMYFYCKKGEIDDDITYHNISDKRIHLIVINVDE